MRVCFVSYHAYPLFDRTCRLPIGGAETHAWMLANELSQRPGFEVHFVVKAPRWFRRQRAGNVTLWNVGDGLDPVRQFVSEHVEVRPEAPWIRVRNWRPSLLWKIPLLAAFRPFRGANPPPGEIHPVYEQMKPDAVCCFGVSGHAATAMASARRCGARTLLFLESNNDLDERFVPGSDYLTPYGERGDICHFVLEAADRIIAQSEFQKAILAQRGGRTSHRMWNAIDCDWWDRLAKSSSRTLENHRVASPYVLWIGRADEFHKRPALCLELARQCRGLPFVMILNPGEKQVEAAIRANAPDNVTIIPQVPFEEMPSVFSHARIYVSTGSKAYEGAPNVFLQSAASAVPILSLEVSGELLDESGGGWCANGNLGQLADWLLELWNHPAASGTMGSRGRQFVETQGSLKSVVDELARNLAEVTATRETPSVACHEV